MNRRKRADLNVEAPPTLGRVQSNFFREVRKPCHRSSLVNFEPPSYECGPNMEQPTEHLPTERGRMAFRRQSGSGVTLVFLHGTGCDASDWEPVFRALPPGQPWLALEFRGHGHSDVPTRAFTIHDLAADVAGALEQLSIDRAILVGHSLGGMVATTVAAQCDRVAGLVLLEGWTSLSTANALGPDRMFGNLSAETERVIRDKATATRARFAPEVWEAFWASVQRLDAHAWLAGARIPIWSVFGAMGRTASTEDALRIPPNPRIQRVWIENAGHYLPHEAPTEVARICREAVRGVGAG